MPGAAAHGETGFGDTTAFGSIQSA
jgi:hypothetical protein